MKKIFFTILTTAFVTIIIISCKNELKEAKLITTRDSLSYAFGVNVASSVKQEKLDTLINSDLFIQGFNAVLSNNNPALTSEQAMKIIQSYFMAQQAKEMEKSKTESEKFLAENAKKEGVKTLPSGLQYKIIIEGKGKKPKANSKVKVNYIGKLINGNVFDSSKSNEPVTFNLGKNEIIPGWEEGLLLMSVGSKYEFYIPYQLAYGEKGYPGIIPPYAALIFEIELVDIEK